MGIEKGKQKYWEREQPKIVVLGKNVFKVFLENGKIQVYPKVDTAPNGVGRGSTIDLENMSLNDLSMLNQLINYAVVNHSNFRQK